MTADHISAAVDDSKEPKTLDVINEEAKDDDTINGEEMDTEEPELTENSNLAKSHIIIRFDGSSKQTNVAFLLKAVLQWLFELDPAMYVETNNSEWKIMQSMNDFPTKEVDFMKCFEPTNNRGGGSAVLIGIHLFSTVSVGLMKKNNHAFMQYLKTKKIGIKTSCGGSKNEVLLFGLLGFNPDKTHRESLAKQLHTQLISIPPDLAERKLLEKAKQVLPFPGMVPKIELQSRWINAESKKYSAKSYAISCASEHADFLRSFLLRCYFEKHVIGLGKLVQLGGRHSTYLPKAITWHNNFVENCDILSLFHISKSAMDQQFSRKTTATKEETTTIRRIILSATEGKAVNLYESRDIESDGRWIVGIDKDKVEHFTVIVATTISKLYENGQISKVHHYDAAPSIAQSRPRRKSNESGVSGFDDDDTSIQSMHSKAWSTVAMNESGSVPRASTNRGKPKIHFVFDPESTEEFPPLPTTHATTHRTENSSVDSTSASTITKVEFDAFETKFTKAMADNLKACQTSMASTLTGDGTQQSAIDEMRAERLAMSEENRAARQQQNEQTQQIMSMFMQFQQMMTSLMPSGPSQPFQPGPMPPFDPIQQRHQQQQQQQTHQQAFQQQQSQDNDDEKEQYQHFQPQNRPPSKIYKRPFDLHPQQPQQQRQERPQELPPGYGWDPYNQRTYAIGNQRPPQLPQHQHPTLMQQQYQQQEFDYLPPGYSQQQLFHDHHQQLGDKAPPGSVGPTHATPERKRNKPLGFNATKSSNAAAAADANEFNEHSTSEGAGGVQE
jgi:hypothetical protein